MRSIRQRDFLGEWIRLYSPRRELPTFASYALPRMAEEMPDLMIYDIEYVDGDARYRVTHEGQRLIDAYGISGRGRFLQDTISAPLWIFLEPIYRKCMETAQPIYSIFSVTDTEGRKVNYERLLLPFGEQADVRCIVASLKSISEEGRFTNKNLMRPVNHDPKYTLRAVIEIGLSPPSRHISVEGDVVEI